MVGPSTRFGLTAGFGDPLGGLLNDLANRRVEVVRQSLRPDSPLLLCVQDFVGQRVRGHFLIPRLRDVPVQVPVLLPFLVDQLGPAGADLAIGNESAINGETVEEALDAITLTLRIASAVGFQGQVFATSIPNLDPDRDFGWMRAFWPRLPAGVVRDYHRYPEIRLPWQVDDDHPWHQFPTLDAEVEAVLAEARGEPVSWSEFSHSTVWRRWLGQHLRVTPEASRDYLVDSLVRAHRYGLTDALVFQINSCVDATSWGCCQGIRDPLNQWLPQADCFRLARERLQGA